MRSNRQLPAQRLLDRLSSSFVRLQHVPASDMADVIERMSDSCVLPAMASSTSPCRNSNQSLARRVSFQINSSDARSFSCPLSEARAYSSRPVQTEFRRVAEAAPGLWKSAEITLAIFGYPPVVCCSTKRIMGEPPSALGPLQAPRPPKSFPHPKLQNGRALQSNPHPVGLFPPPIMLS